MSFFRGSETVIIKRRSSTATDDYGNKVFSTTTITVKNCMIGFGGSGEPVQTDRDPIDTALTIYLPNGTVVEPGDRFIVRGIEFIKDGDATVYKPPFDFNVGVVVQVRKRNG